MPALLNNIILFIVLFGIFRFSNQFSIDNYDFNGFDPNELFSSVEFDSGDISPECWDDVYSIRDRTYENWEGVLASTGKTLGDVGNWWECTDYRSTHHCLVTLPDCYLQIPECNIGLCLPETCNQQDVKGIAAWFIDSELKSLNLTLPVEIVTDDLDVHCHRDTGLFKNPIAFIALALILVTSLIVIVSTVIYTLHTGSYIKLFKKVEIEVEDNNRTEKVDEENESGSQVKYKKLDKEDEDEEELNSILDEEEIEVDKNGDNLTDLLENNYNDKKSFLKDFRELYPEDSLLIKLAKCWSIENNLKRLFNPIPGEFGGLNYLRCVSMLWVIVGHTLFFWGAVGLKNSRYAYDVMLKQFWFQALPAGVFGVDSFFFLSGFLVTYFTYQHLLSGKKFQWFLYYFHRLWRILPLYLFIMTIYNFLSPIMSNGPFWYYFQDIVNNGIPYCWANLIFINNFYPLTGGDQCMGWGWFLAVDMQFYIFSPFLIILHYKKPKIGWIVLAILLSINISLSAIIVSTHEFNPFNLSASGPYFDLFYQKPYCRASPYLVGMASAYIYTYLKNNTDYTSKKIKSWMVFIGYGIASCIMFSVVFGTYDDYEWNVIQDTLYLALSRFAWAIALGFFMVSFFLGYGGILRRFVNSYYWMPFAKLTYSAYLIHPVIMFIFYFSFEDWYYINPRTVMYFFFSHVILSYLFAIYAYCFIEKPFMNMEPLFLQGLASLVKLIINTFKGKKSRSSSSSHHDDDHYVEELVEVELSVEDQEDNSFINDNDDVDLNIHNDNDSLLK